MPATTQPNIIYLISDQHRGQAMGHMGDPNVRTPHMDRLADADGLLTLSDQPRLEWMYFDEGATSRCEVPFIPKEYRTS